MKKVAIIHLDNGDHLTDRVNAGNSAILSLKNATTESTSQKMVQVAADNLPVGKSPVQPPLDPGSTMIERGQPTEALARKKSKNLENGKKIDR